MRRVLPGKVAPPLADLLHRHAIARPVSTRVQLAEAIDRVLHKGAVLRGDVVISVADVDLLFLDLRIVLSAVDTAMKSGILSEDGPARAPALHDSDRDADEK